MLRLVDIAAESHPKGSVDTSQVAGHDALGALATRAAAGERGAQRTLLCAVAPSLLKVIRGALGQYHPDIDNVFQETCLALLRALPRFRGECTTLYFACRIAALTAMNARRRTLAAKTVDYDACEDQSPDESSPAEDALQARQRQVLRQLMDELPPERAEVLVLHVMLGYTVDETSAATQVPVNTVRSRLRRALNALRERLSADTQLLEVVRGNDET